MTFDFSSIVEPIKEIFEKHAKDYGKKGEIEIEGRLGIYDHDEKKFDTNIGEDNYAQIKSMLDSCREWSSVDNLNITDQFSDNLRLSTNNKTSDKICVEKKKLASFTLISETSPLDLRISISVEIPVKPERFLIKNVSYQREKNRHQYKLDDYSYDLTKITTTSKKAKEEHFEYEVERVCLPKKTNKSESKSEPKSESKSESKMDQKSESKSEPKMDQIVFSLIMKLLDASYSCDGFFKTKDNSLPIDNIDLRIV